jgi:GT2 family glycosyltransferase
VIYLLTVNYYSTNLVTKLITSVSPSPNIEYQIVIVNNSPDDNSIYCLQTPSILILNAINNLGFGKACNLGIKYIYERDPHSIIWIVNPDAYFLENVWEKVNYFFESHTQISILGTIVYTPENQVWFGGGRFFPKTGTILSEDLITNTDVDYIICDWVSGCSLLINLRNFRECPLFDPAYFLYYEDFDFCQRYARQGHLIAVTKLFGVWHQPSAITNRFIFSKIKHSTYSYLLTLERYTNKFVFGMRLLRLILHALVLIVFQPQVAKGKLDGILRYWQTKIFSESKWC